MTLSNLQKKLPNKTANLRPIPILVYHQISEAPLKGSPFRSLYVTPKAFARQMAWLKFLGYTGLSMGGLLPYLRGEKVGKVVGITFDDGYKNNLTNALPILIKNNFSSTCYAVSGLLGKTNMWDQSIGIAQTSLMSEVEIGQWVNAGQASPELDESDHREPGRQARDGDWHPGRQPDHHCGPFDDDQHHRLRHDGSGSCRRAAFSPAMASGCDQCRDLCAQPRHPQNPCRHGA